MALRSALVAGALGATGAVLVRLSTSGSGGSASLVARAVMFSAALLCNASAFSNSYADHAKTIGINYLCVFNGGTWDWGNSLPPYFSQFINYIK